jgi:hypothetical protein
MLAHQIIMEDNSSPNISGDSLSTILHRHEANLRSAPSSLPQADHLVYAFKALGLEHTLEKKETQAISPEVEPEGKKSPGKHVSFSDETKITEKPLTQSPKKPQNNQNPAKSNNKSISKQAAVPLPAVHSTYFTQNLTKFAKSSVESLKLRWLTNNSNQHSSHFHLADYNSVVNSENFTLWVEIIDNLRLIWPKHSQSVTLSHVQSTIESLAATISALQGQEKAYKKERGAVFTLFAHGSLNSPCFAANSIDLATSLFHLHLLFRTPSPISSFLSLYAENSEAKQWTNTAAEEWDNFLKFRAAEVKLGGMLMISSYCSADGNNGRIGLEQGFATIYSILEQMTAEKLLDSTELTAIVVPFYFRSRQEFTDKQILARNGWECLEFHVAQRGSHAVQQFLKDKNALQLADQLQAFWQVNLLF